MDFEIVWTKRADREFEVIIEYLAKEWSNRVKNNFIENFMIHDSVFTIFPKSSSALNP